MIKKKVGSVVPTAGRENAGAGKRKENLREKRNTHKKKSSNNN